MPTAIKDLPVDLEFTSDANEVRQLNYATNCAFDGYYLRVNDMGEITEAHGVYSPQRSSNFNLAYSVGHLLP